MTIDHACVVLIVDDDPDLREILKTWLIADGYRVTTAGNGREALYTLRSTPRTCAILLDLAMPVMDGMRFRAAQCRDRSLAWIPVIVMGGGLEIRRVARELGAQGFVRKPFDIQTVRQAIHDIGCASRPRSH